MGHKVSNELWGGMLASILSDRRQLEFFLESIVKKCKNGQFFAFSQIKWDFATASYIQGTTMWKLTSWRFRKCVTYWVLKFLNKSYCCSKSGDSEILAPLAKIRGRKKKPRSQYLKSRAAIESALKQPCSTFADSTWSLNFAFWTRYFFFTASFPASFFFRFGSTLTANN